MIILAWLVAILCVIKNGEIIYSTVTMILFALASIKGGLPSVLNVRQNSIVGYFNGLLGTIALYYAMKWSLSRVLSDEPFLLKYWVALFVGIIFLRVMVGHLKISAYKHTEANGISREAVIARLHIPPTRCAIAGIITASVILGIAAIVR